MVCGICGKGPATPCGGCGTVKYCGKECQKKDWRDHKSLCRNYKITTSVEEHGRHIISSRDIKAGEKILTTSPEVVGPRLFQPFPCCLGCHRGSGKLVLCAQCHLPVCGTKCSSSSRHQMECTLLVKYRQNTAEDVGLETVFPLRIIALKYTEPTLFEKILSMESNVQDIKKSGKWKTYQSTILEPLMNLNIDEMDKDTLESIIGIVLTNCFEVVTQDSLLIGIFHEASFMNHDCIGNTRVSMDEAGKMTVHASVLIKKNLPIKFNYVKSLDSTWVRQIQLLENKFFSCSCTRCQDPTELGSFVSAHSCTDDNCGGAVIPLEPLNMNADWICTQCKQTTVATDIRKILKNLEKDTETLNKDDLKNLRKTLAKYENKLHRNHGVLTELKQILVSGYGRLPDYQVEDMNESDHKYKLQLCYEVLAVLDIVEPGVNLGRGLLLFELHTSLVILANLEFEKKRNPNQLLVRLLEAETMLSEADTILRLESPSSPYGHLAASVQRNKFELGQYIQSVKTM